VLYGLERQVRRFGAAEFESRYNPSDERMAHDQAIGTACSLGNLEPSAFLPLVADALLTSIEMGILTGEQFDQLITPEAVTRLGSPDRRG
jgi:fumarate hydratase class II